MRPGPLPRILLQSQSHTITAGYAAGVGTGLAVSTVQVLQQKKIQEDITKLQIEAAQVGMSEAQKKVDDLKRGGATDTQLEQAKGLQTILMQ